jgi:hypothetical protein
VYGPRGLVNEQSFHFKHLMKRNGVLYFIALFCFSFFLSKFELGKFDFREPPAGPEAREKGRILAKE